VKFDVLVPFALPRRQTVLRSSGLNGQMSASEAGAEIVPYNPSAFPPYMDPPRLQDV